MHVSCICNGIALSLLPVNLGPPLTLSATTTLADPGLDDLGLIQQAGRNFLVHRRPLPGELVQALEEAALGELRKVEFEVLDGAVDGAALVSELPEGPARDWVARDVERWGRRVAELTGVPRFHASFSQVIDDKCRKFHVDYVGLRLLVTYAGPGTEIAPDEIVNRTALDEPAHCYIEANEAILRDVSQVVHADVGDVVLLKGDRWPGNEGKAAVHRSPPVSERKLRRLVLTISSFGAGGRPW